MKKILSLVLFFFVALQAAEQSDQIQERVGLASELLERALVLLRKAQCRTFGDCVGTGECCCGYCSRGTWIGHCKSPEDCRELGYSCQKDVLCEKNGKS